MATNNNRYPNTTVGATTHGYTGTTREVEMNYKPVQMEVWGDPMNGTYRIIFDAISTNCYYVVVWGMRDKLTRKIDWIGGNVKWNIST